MSKLAGATVLETACRAMLLATLAEPRLQAALNELTKNGVRIETRSDKMMSAFRHAWHEVVNEEGDHDPMFKRVLEDLEDFRTPNADV
jgi:TRAP-type mannitol/chloroaromatic compound transport system substrate-binding protein